mmetsp:Transcript_10618/g.22821  ORF Transcript_10618/g.22821 Transcript_10618/m.22821 type:complete len:286 (-) Transcript_10618:145-1002(-)
MISPNIYKWIGLATLAILLIFELKIAIGGFSMDSVNLSDERPFPSSFVANSQHGKKSYPSFRDAAEKKYFQDVCKDDLKRTRPQFFDIVEWKRKSLLGGLHEQDRVMLGKYYGTANSVFEWGLGESSYMAGHLNVPRYAGVDSHADWVSKARDQCPKHYRFYFGDIGETLVNKYGRPVEHLPKSEYDYIISPLMSELCPFDVYMVDGRYRAACALMALLHSSDHDKDATILIHDYTHHRPGYKIVEQVCDIVEESGQRLVAFKRKPNVTNELIYELYQQVKDNWE